MTEQLGDDVREVVVGVDGSDGSRRALAWGLREAFLRRVGLRVVTVWTGGSPPGDGDAPAAVAEFEEALEARVRSDVAEAARATGAMAVPVVPEVRYGHPARSLMDVAAHDGLLVVGARGTGGLRGLLLGSVSQQCAQHAACPVVVVRGDVPGERIAELRRVVVGVDGSEHSVAAARLAHDEAELRDAQLHVVHTFADTVSGYGGPLWVVPDTTLAEQAEATLRASLRAAGLDALPGDRVRAEVRQGIDWDVLLDVAEGADLLVVGSRGRSGWAGLLLGSVGLHAVTAAPCPVVVVRPRGAAG
ncbi:universal stress protein [Geodermatophilus sp. URMC 61]|uniref:universal stress protein n=1 Tax=Geodermatophilus sp. URMC 61 TaxID=3423411 RepID=UPI00406D4218